MPAPVASRRRLTSAAVKSAMSLLSRSGVDVVRVCGVRAEPSGRATAPSPRRAGTAPGGSAVLGALRARGGVAGGGHALDRGDLVGGDRRGLGGGLPQRGGRGGGGRGGGPPRQGLAPPVRPGAGAHPDGARGPPAGRAR